MKHTIYLGVILLVSPLFLPEARAEEPWMLFDGCHWKFPHLCQLWQQRKCWCPNDYCAKSLPCVPPNVKGCVDDYCPKKLPCVPPNVKGCVDDYCPKTCPIMLGGNCEPWYTCGPCGLLRR